MAGDRAHPARATRRRGYGQHFLRSPRLADALVREAGIRTTDLVLEIGSGSGRLTAALADSGAQVRALELDPAWAARLRERFGGRANVEVIEADALAAPLPDESFRAVGNLPFQHTTAILRRLLHDPLLPLVRADLIVQWEVARKRASCWPGTLLNAYWGAWYEFQTVRRLPAACFEPRPTVDAAVLRIVRRSEPLVAVAERAQYLAFVRAGFGRGGPGVRRQRRLKRTARDLGLPPGAGATELDVHQWAALFRAIRRTG